MQIIDDRSQNVYFWHNELLLSLFFIRLRWISPTKHTEKQDLLIITQYYSYIKFQHVSTGQYPVPRLTSLYQYPECRKKRKCFTYRWTRSDIKYIKHRPICCTLFVPFPISSFLYNFVRRCSQRWPPFANWLPRKIQPVFPTQLSHFARISASKFYSIISKLP